MGSTTAMFDETDRAPERDLSVPIVWGVAAGLFVAVMMRGVLGGAIVLVLALLTFAAVVSVGGGRRLVRRRAPRLARLMPETRPSSPRPPAAMVEAALGQGHGVAAGAEASKPAAALGIWPTPVAPARKSGWLGPAERLALGATETQEDTDRDATAKQG